MKKQNKNICLSSNRYVNWLILKVCNQTMEEKAMKVPIPDFNALLINNTLKLQTSNASTTHFFISSQWFAFQRKIITDVYGEFKDKHAFKIYLYLCKFYNQKARKTPKTKSQINDEMKYVKYKTRLNVQHKYLKRVDDALEWLEDEGFIKVMREKTKQWYQASILIAPDYHKGFYGGDDVFDINAFLKSSNDGYIMIPQNAIEVCMLENSSSANRKWNVRNLSTIMLLYGHCWIEYFGGIDPDIVTIEPNGDMTIYEGFCYDLKGSSKDISDTVLWLINRKLFKPVNCVFVEGVYYGDVGKCNAPIGSNYKERIVLRPYNIIEHKLNSVDMIGKITRMIL
jgi:hypothetical protein